MTTTAILKLTTPEGRPFDLVLDQTSTEEEVMAVLKNAGNLGNWLVGKGCRFADAQPSQPALAEQKALTAGAGPTFCGYPCSPTVNEAGFPSWIVVDGKQAERHEKQGDVWWSVGEGPKGERKYHQVLRIPKGEKVPPVLGLPAA